MTDVEREAVHSGFWCLNSSNERANYIISHTAKQTKRRKVIAPQLQRGENIKYFLPRSDGAKLEVCKVFFLRTLCISDKMVSYNLARSVNGVKPSTVRPPPSNKISEDAIQSVEDHIKSFSVVESHYCRSTTHRRYLQSDLNKTKMYNMYLESAYSHQAVRQHLYGRIFDEQFNLGFHKPSKDVCDFCDKYTKAKAAGLLTEDMTQEKEQHDIRKTEAREHKEKDKITEGTMTVTCDLQQVMSAPRFFAGSSYYKRKLNVYNFTVYEVTTREGYCYTWTEAECHRGANDVASCLVKYLHKIDAEESYTRVVIYSDTCGGQNRNRIVCTAISSFLSSAKTVKVVEQKFFESGHSHMECDSMHSAIETAFKSTELDLPSDYMTCMKTARSKKPYHIIEMVHSDVQNFDLLNERAFKKDAFKGIIKAHHIKYMKQESRTDLHISMSNRIEESATAISWRKRGGQISLSKLEPAYSTPCGIDKDKKSDLLSMVDFAASRTMYKLYYESLAVKN